MHFNPSSISAFALLLSLSPIEARVLNSKNDLVATAAPAQEPAVPGAAIEHVFEKRQNNTNECNDSNDIYEFLATYSSSESVCSAVLGVQTVTQYDVITSTTFVTDTTATSVATRTVVQRTTATLTVTAGGVAKRGPNPTAAPEKREVAQAQRAQMRDYIHQAIENGTVTGTSMAPPERSSFWSEVSYGVTEACRCLNLPTAASSTITYTAPGVATHTVNVWIQSTETVMSTLTYSETETVPPGSLAAQVSATASASASAGAGASVSGPAISCPESNNTYTQYEVNNRIYYFKVVCGVEFTDATLISLHSETAADCAGACSAYNEGANARACAGFDFYTDVAAGGYTCDLKGNMTMSHAAESVLVGALVAVYANGNAPPFASTASDTTALAEITAPINTQVASACSANSTQSATGTAFTTTFTDSAGLIHESWYSGTAFAASSAEICTYNYTEQYTTQVVFTLPGTTITGAAVISATMTGTEVAGATAFSSNGEIIVAHTSGTVIGSAMPGPATPFVTPVSTISAGGSAVSTIYATGTVVGGELNMTATTGTISAVTSGAMVNETVVLSNGTVVTSVWTLGAGGSTLITVVSEGATSTAFSTGSEIILTPTTTGGETVIITGGVSTSITVGVNETASISETVLISGGATATSGEIVISPTTEVIPTTLSNVTLGTFTLGGGTSGASSTGGEIVISATSGALTTGGETIIIPTTISLSPSESIVTFINATSGASSTGGEIIINATATVGASVTGGETVMIPTTISLSPSESLVTFINATSGATSTGGEIIFTPTPIPSINVTSAILSNSTSESVITLVGGTTTVGSTGGEIILTPTSPFSNTNGLRTGEYSVPTPSSGFPVPSANVTFPGTVVATPVAFSDTNGLRTGAFSTGSEIIARPSVPGGPIINATLPFVGTAGVPTTSTLFSNTNGLRTGEYSLSTPGPSSGFPVPSSNASSTVPFSDTNGLRTGAYSTSSLPFYMPPAPPALNYTFPGTGTAPASTSPFSNTNGLRTGEYSMPTPVPSSGSPVPSFNATIPFIGTAATPTAPFSNTNGLRTGEYSVPTPPSSGAPVPSLNSTTPGFSNTNGLRTGEYSIPTPAPSSGAPVPSLNSTIPGFSNTNGLRTGEYSLSTPSSGLPSPSPNGTLIVPFAPLTGVTPLPTLNSTLPGTGTPPGFSNTNGLRTGGYSLPTPPSSGLPVPSLNSTLPGTGIVGAPVSGSIPTPSLNTTAPGFSNTNGLRTGQYSVSTPLASSGFPVLSANATAPSSGFPTASVNSTVPGFSNTNGLRTGQYSLPTPLASSGFPMPSLNATHAPSSGLPIPSANSSIPGFSNTNGLRTGEYSLPTPGPSSGFPVPSANASTCITGPAMTVTVTSTSVSVSVSTLCATDCAATLSSASATSSPAAYLPPNNYGPPPPAYSGLVKRSLQSDSRRSAKVATQQHIDDACAETDNIIANADFESANADWSPEDWNVTDSTPGSIFLASSNGARAVSSGRNANVQIAQPLTLCPKSTYMLKAVASQPIASAGCIVSFSIGGEDVLTVQPSEKAATYSATYTAGSKASSVSVDLVIDFGSCSNADTMMLSLEGVSLEPARQARWEQARKTLVKQAFGDWDLKKKQKA